MSATLTMLPGLATSTPPTARCIGPVDDPIRRQVWTLLAGVYPNGQSPERRADQRFPLPQLIYLNPLGPDGLAPAPETVVVVGKQLSERGLGFFHPQPIPHRRMVVSLESREGFLGFLIDITWCRFTRHGWYESGGRFLQTLPSPVQRGKRADG